MRRRPLALVLTAALIGAVFTALPAKAATEVPSAVQIDDPVGDANTQAGDVQFGQDASTVGDLMKVWFSNTDTTISLHIQTEAPAPSSTSNIRYNVYTNPTVDLTGTSSCLRFEIIPTSATPVAYQGATLAKVMDRCTEEAGSFYRADRGEVGELVVEELADGTGLMTATFPRTYGPVFADGAQITQPFAIDYIGGGTDKATIPGSPATNEGPVGFTGLRLDDSKLGTDFTISGDGAEPPVVEEPKEPKPAKNPCKKLKGKKKKKCLKKHAAKPCTAFTPGEKGAEAETSVVTDAATAEAPVEVPLTMDPLVGAFSGEVNGQANPLVSHAIQNVQVDSNSKDSGLYVRVEFPEGEDYDLYLFDTEGNDAAHAGGGNQAPEELGDGTGNGGHSETTAEQLDGVLTSDCGGYTVDVANAIGMGEATLTFWLGDATWDPAAQAPIESGSSKAFVF